MIYKIIFIVISIIYFLYNLLLDILEIKSLKNQIPENLSDIYDKEKYEKFSLYTKDNTRV